MKEFKKHDFGFFSSKEELQDTLNRKKASILFESTRKDVSMNEFSRMFLKLTLLDAISLGLNPTCLVKDRLEMILNDDVDTIFCMMKGENPEGLSNEEILEMWKEEGEEFKGMTENEIYDVISK
jgi:hypothetical protein